MICYSIALGLLVLLVVSLRVLVLLTKIKADTARIRETTNSQFWWHRQEK